MNFPKVSYACPQGYDAATGRRNMTAFYDAKALARQRILPLCETELDFADAAAVLFVIGADLLRALSNTQQTPQVLGRQFGSWLTGIQPQLVRHGVLTAEAMPAEKFYTARGELVSELLSAGKSPGELWAYAMGFLACVPEAWAGLLPEEEQVAVFTTWLQIMEPINELLEIEQRWLDENPT